MTDTDHPRIVAVADTDSYVKWAAALLAPVPGAELIVLETELVVSLAQQRAALEGSGLKRVRRATYDQLPTLLAGADAVLLAARGPLVRVLARLAAQLDPAPVILTGLPGISIPPTWLALHFRRGCDLFVLHSRREVREFRALAAARGIAQRFALATLPFARAANPVERNGTDLVFAAQAIVPALREHREHVARLLVRAARAHPDRRVVLKLRARPGEAETHRELVSYPELMAQLGEVPPNLVTSTAPMVEALATAEGLVTVSSTAAIEAAAQGVPVIALDTFGVSGRLINLVFEGSGLLAGDDEVVARRFRTPEPDWLGDNYFHDRAEDDWLARTAELVRRRRAGLLPPRPVPRLVGGRARDAWERKLALGDRDRSLSGALAYAVGVPVRRVLRIVRRHGAGRRASGAGSAPTPA
ncbi:DUF6716 putative glycosyltransferase [Microbacterium sp. Marseille-Q6965]|uniref:DUF6716 putative glycosyltransferase n=1 Tax=Microbacterium sp. Marseille-Q6965 TaxID=2965072 RepID=UPI0021B796C3|nr:DUF6716 putative glycosyltransferase [Microbacterium sp. Marseille-Q6965]